MSDYRIEKLRWPVLVILNGGAHVQGEIFLNPASRFHAGPQAPFEFFNEEAPFFALAPEDGAPMLIAKDTVERIETPEPAAEESPAPPAHPMTVELMLTSGTACVGALHLEMPSHSGRLLDYLNAYRERFLQVVQPDHLLLVNRRAIAIAHELN